MRVKLVFPWILFLASNACTAFKSPDEAPEIRESAEHIHEAGLRGHIRFLADDLLTGRAPGTEGGQIGERYIASQLQLLGLTPGARDVEGRESWFQTFDILGITSEVPKSVTVKGSIGALDLKYWDDFIAFTGEQKPEVEVQDAEIVFVGYGIEAPEQQWDDYKDANLSGKILLMMNNDPSDDPKLFAGKTRLYYGRWTYKYEIAARKGAVGAIIIHTEPSAGYKFQVVQTSWTGEQFELPRAQGTPTIALKGWVTEEAGRRVAELAGQNLDQLRADAERRDFRPVPLGVRVSMKMQNAIRSLRTANVLGVLEGRDPELRKEHVVYTAHHDHLGVGAADTEGDTIYNGAVDNASGVAAILAIAKAFTSLPPHQRPRRSILFAAVAAEESGLLGSQQFCADPPVSPGYLAANINIDGVAIFGPTRDVVIVGMGKSSMDDEVATVAARHGRIVKGDPFPDKGFFYRSDQFNFAKIGVPAAYLDAGSEVVGAAAGWGEEQLKQWEATRYHQPSDEYDDSWNLTGAVADTRLLFEVGMNIANRNELPAWHPGDEFEAARKSALARRN